METAVEKDIQTYTIDPSHSRLGFKVRHMGFSRVRGNFEEFEGVIRVDPSDLSTFEAEGAVQTTSVTTHDAKRDEHLRSEDFFDVENHPTLTFEAAEVREVSDGSFKVAGDLSIRGRTKRVVLDAEFLGAGKDPWGNTRVAFEAGTTISRKDFGLTWNAPLEAGGVLVGDKVDLTLEVQAVQQDGGDAE